MTISLSLSLSPSLSLSIYVRWWIPPWMHSSIGTHVRGRGRPRTLPLPNFSSPSRRNVCREPLFHHSYKSIYI